MRVYCEIKPEKFATHMEFVEGNVTPRGILVHNSLVSPDAVHCYVHFFSVRLGRFHGSENLGFDRLGYGTA